MRKIFYIIPLVFFFVFAKGQPIQDTTFLRSSVVKAENTYHKAMNKDLNILNGRGYKDYTPTKDEHPYFLTDDWVIGTIIYESDYYAEVPLLFDISSEKVITENLVNGAKMELVYNKIDQFEISQHVFVKLHNDPSFTSEMTEGFYELLFDGQLKLYAQRKKSFQQRITGNTMRSEFDEKNKYFLFNGKTYVRATGKKSITHALGDTKKLPKPPGMKIDPNSTNKLEDKLIYLIKFYNSHTSTL